MRAKNERQLAKAGCFFIRRVKMPYRPKKPCRQPGCPELTNDVFCEKHKKENNKIYNQYQRDELSRTFYRTPRWIETRKKKLHLSPFCEECKKVGTMVVGKVVDHIVPIKQGGEPYDLDNLQTLCWSCHSRKSIEEGSRFGAKKY